MFDRSIVNQHAAHATRLSSYLLPTYLRSRAQFVSHRNPNSQRKPFPSDSSVVAQQRRRSQAESSAHPRGRKGPPTSLRSRSCPAGADSFFYRARFMRKPLPKAAVPSLVHAKMLFLPKMWPSMSRACPVPQRQPIRSRSSTSRDPESSEKHVVCPFAKRTHFPPRLETHWSPEPHYVLFPASRIL